jgi:hypothetical protein
MASMNLSKQIGPLPLGAWIAVVAGGLGIALYTRRQNAAVPVEVEDGSGTPGVGTGAVGGWLPTSPQPDTGITTQPIITNEQWAVRAINDLIAQNYNPTLADSAIRKYIAGTPLSIGENALLAIALAKWGSPPQPLPPTEGGGTTVPPPASTGTVPAAPTVTVSINNLGIASIRWTHSEGATSYVVYGGPVGSGLVSSRVILTHALHAYFWTGMKRGQTYAFSVAARNAYGYNISRVVNAKRS